MKISNVKVDLCNWHTEPWKTGVGTAFGGTVQLGLVTVETDAGVSGNASWDPPWPAPSTRYED